VHVQPAQPATAAVSAAAPGDEDAFFGASHANHGADHDLFAEPERRGLPAAVWAIIAIFVVGGLVAFAMSRNTPESRPTPDAGTAAAIVSPDAGTAVAPVAAEVAGSGEGSGSGDGATVDAAATLAAATLGAQQSGTRAATDTNYKAEGIAVDATSGAAAPPVVAAPATTTTTSATTTSTRPSSSTDSSTSSRPSSSTTTTTASAPTTREARQAMDACSQAYAAGNYGETITLCEAAVRANPTAASGLVYLGMARFEVGDTQEAVTYLERALRIDGRDSSALLTLGAAKQELGDNEGARAAYERYLQYFPDSRRAEEVRTILQGL
jgi:TolA-binding protein